MSVFYEAYYLANNPDVALAVDAGVFATGWNHFIAYGAAEGRSFAAPAGYGDFNEEYYLANNPDVAIAVETGVLGSGWQHYVAYGMTEGRSYAMPDGYGAFNELYYLSNNPDVANAVDAGIVASGWAHYLAYGQAEGRSIAAPALYDGFNEWYYLANNPDVAYAVETGGLGTGWEHYVRFGYSEGRDAGMPDAFMGVEYGGYIPLGEIPNPGASIYFTPQLDLLPGTTGDDTFYAVLGAENATNDRVTTFNSGDSANGSDGNDTLILTAEDDYYDDNVVELLNIENVVIRNYADDDIDLDAYEWQGVDSFGADGGDDDVSISYIGEAFSTVVLKDIRVDDFDFELEVANDVFTGDDDTVTVILDNAGMGPVRVPGYTVDDDVLQGGNQSIDGVETYLDIYNYSGDAVIENLNIVSTGGNPRGNLLYLYSNDLITDLVITGDTDLFLRQYDPSNLQLETVDASGLDANFEFRGGMGALPGPDGVTITGATGNNDVTGSYYDDVITTFDGNDVIKGNGGDDVIDAGEGDNEVHVDNGDSTITTGSGDDMIHVGGAVGDMTIDTGDGNDTVRMWDTLTTGDSIDGGRGTDTLSILGYLAADATTAGDGLFEGLFEGFEIITLGNLGEGGPVTVDMADLDNIQYVALHRDLYTSTIEGLTDGATLEMANWNGNAAAITTVELPGSAGSFNLFLNSDRSDADDQDPDDVDMDFGNLVLDGIEELNLSTGTRCKDFDVTDADGRADGIDVSFINYMIDLDMDSLETLNIEGNVSLNLTGVNLTDVTTVAASHFDADLDISLFGNLNDVDLTAGDGDNFILGGDGDDTTIVGDGDNVIFDFVGNDTIIAGDGDNTIFAGDGNDTVTTGEGDDVIAGNAGIDILTGGDGNDIFVYMTATDSQGVTIDVIQDFVSGDDQLDITGFVAYLGEALDYGAVLTSFTGTAGDAVLDKGSSILYVDIDGDAGLTNADMAIQLAGVTDLNGATDFI